VSETLDLTDVSLAIREAGETIASGIPDPEGSIDRLGEAIVEALFSRHERDRHGEGDGNIVDGLFAVARALDRIADAMEKRPPE
jgi:hypothetical protein